MRWVRLVLLATMPWPSAALAESINIDFGDLAGPSPLGPDFGAASGQTGAWNSITAVETTLNLVGLDGSATDLTLTLGPASVNPSGASGLVTGETGLLLSDFFFEGSETDFWFVVIRGIDPGVYDVYVYAPANNSSQQGTGDYSINGIPMSDIPGSGLQNFIPRENMIGVPGNYDVLSDLTVTGGVIGLESNEYSTRLLGLSGIQIIAAAPEPATGPLLAFALVALASRRHRGSRSRVVSAGSLRRAQRPLLR